MKQRLFFYGAAVFTALFIFFGLMLAGQYADGKQSADAFEDITALIQEEPVEPGVPLNEIPSDGAARQTAYEKYAAVYEQNNDFIGWIWIDGTNIDYPVMQTPDRPDFYLKRAFDQSYSKYGVPYVQENCDVGLSDNVIIYGHHMKNGSMFSDLCKYEEEGFYQDHKIIHFDTLEAFGEYEIVAVYKTVVYSEQGFKYYHFVNAENPAVFDEYIEQCEALALYDTGVSAEYGDKLITLSTCEYSNGRTNGRIVVVAKQRKPSNEENGDG